VAASFSARRQARLDAAVRREHAYALSHLDGIGPHPLERSALVAAALVHLLVVALAAGAVLVWFTGLTGVVKLFLSVLLAAVAYVAAPAHPHRATGTAGPAEGSQLMALITAVSERVGLPAPRRVRLVPEVTSPWQQRRGTVTLSMPVWAALTPRARLALVALSAAASAGGDVRRRPVVAGAFRSLDGWMFLLRPDTAPAPTRPPRPRLFGSGTTTPRGGGTRLTDMVLPIVLFPLYLLILGLSWWLRAATVGSAQRDGYRAALTAVTLCGRDATDEVLRAVLMRRRVAEEVEAARARRENPLDAARRYLSGLDPAVVDAMRTRERTPPYTLDESGAPPAALVEEVVRAAPERSADLEALERLEAAASDAMAAPTG
jgi:hypothetical protein